MLREDLTGEQGATAQRPHKSGRRNGGTLIGCAILVIAIMACIAWYQRDTGKRYRVIGKIDPASGYSIEYTISSHYRYLSPANSFPRQEARMFFLPPPPGIVQWAYANILRRPSSAAWNRPNLIIQNTISSISPLGLTIDPAGYVGVSAGRRQGLVLERSLMSGCPATFYAYDTLTILARRQFTRNFVLLIKPKSGSEIIRFAAYDSVTAPTGVLTEMRKIRDSVRMVKVK